MVNVLDVAAYILEKQSAMTTLKLQKLIYYSQAWSLVWDEEALFEEQIEAWANGPVVRELYEAHRGRFKIGASDITGDSESLNEWQRETIDAIMESYGPQSSQWLSDLTHNEQPWIEARHGLLPGERGCNVISHSSMAEYYEAVGSDGIDILV